MTKLPAAHPRSRGENSFARPLKARENGSSPLTRGKPGVAGWVADERRLIPAHAGKTRPCVSDLEAPAAHPRSRGENAIFGVSRAKQLGSSPLTRGKLHTTT